MVEYLENFLTNMAVKEFWKSVHICQSCDKKIKCLVFLRQSVQQVEVKGVWATVDILAAAVVVYLLDTGMSRHWVSVGWVAQPMSQASVRLITPDMIWSTDELSSRALITPTFFVGIRNPYGTDRRIHAQHSYMAEWQSYGIVFIHSFILFQAARPISQHNIHIWCLLKNVNLSLWLSFKRLINPAAVFFLSDVTGTDWHVTSGR